MLKPNDPSGTREMLAFTKHFLEDCAAASQSQLNRLAAAKLKQFTQPGENFPRFVKESGRCFRRHARSLDLQVNSHARPYVIPDLSAGPIWASEDPCIPGLEFQITPGGDFKTVLPMLQKALSERWGKYPSPFPRQKIPVWYFSPRVAELLGNLAGSFSCFGMRLDNNGRPYEVEWEDNDAAWTQWDADYSSLDHQEIYLELYKIDPAIAECCSILFIPQIRNDAADTEIHFPFHHSGEPCDAPPAPEVRRVTRLTLDTTWHIYTGRAYPHRNRDIGNLGFWKSDEHNLIHMNEWQCERCCPYWIW